MAALDATDRGLMTAALVGTGLSYVLTALGLFAAAPLGRLALGIGGIATILVAAFPLPSRDGGSQAHTVAATVAFVALAVWPLLGFSRGADTPAALRPAVSITAAVVLLGLVAAFAVTLQTGGPVGLAERLAASAQAIWPLIVALSNLSRPSATGPRYF